MCFNARHAIGVALKRAIQNGQAEDAKFWLEQLKKFDEVYKPQDLYQVSAFAHPRVIVYENDNPFEPVVSVWGLVPDWAKDPEKIWNSTLNARGETIFEKSAFRKSAESKRCLIPVEGFYDHHDFKGKKYPFYITGKEKDEPLYFAGLWNDWTNKETGEIINTYTVLTTRANPLIAKIHNKPKLSDDPRMPVILPEDLQEEWLKPLSRREVQELATYVFPDSKLDAWTVPKLSGKNSPGNVPEANQKCEYEELQFASGDQLSLF